MELEPKTTWFIQNTKPFSQTFEPIAVTENSDIGRVFTKEVLDIWRITE